MTDIRTGTTSTERESTARVEPVEHTSPQVTVVPDARPSHAGDQPAEQIFAKAAIYRPITIATSLAAILFMLYGVFAAGTVVTSDGSPNSTEPVPSVTGAIAISPTVDPSPTECSLIEVETYLDFDGNGVRNAGELPVAGVPITVRSPAGLDFLSETDAEGQLAFQLGTPSQLSLEPGSMQEIGMWPGPRLGTLGASEIVLSGPTCSTSLGYLWVPPGAETPNIGWAPESVDPSGTPGEAVSAILGQTGGVQTYGRLWYEQDGDGRFSLADQPAAGVEVTLLDERGTEVARLESNELGAYSFAALSPRTRYEIRIDAPVTGARALGWLADNPTSSAFVRTGATGLPVWGVDFILDDGTGAPADDANEPPLVVDRAN